MSDKYLFIVNNIYQYQAIISIDENNNKDHQP